MKGTRKRLIASVAIYGLYLLLPGSLALAHCFSVPVPIPFGMTYAVGPNVYQFVSNNLVVLDAIRAGRDAWDVTNAKDYIGDWNGVVVSSDCPPRWGQAQIGAWNFSDPNDPKYYCWVLVENPDLRGVLAFVDYGSRSISANLYYPWSTNPGPYEYDIQSVAAHEFGHVLGLSHYYNGVCDRLVYNYPCSFDPYQETMATYIYIGETCHRDLAPHDIEDANEIYVPDGGTDGSPSSW